MNLTQERRNNMEAPDKIYAGYRFKNNYEDLYARKTQLTNRDTEYIRKDDILEWAEKKLQERHAPQFRDAIGQLIDKLNLM